MSKWEVFYTYTVDASIKVEAESKQAAIDKVMKAWDNEEPSVANPKTLDYSDFEVLYAKKR